MIYYYSSKKPFEDNIQPFYPGNLPYLSQYFYKKYIFKNLNLLKKKAGYS